MKRSHKLAGRRPELKHATVCKHLVKVVEVSCDFKKGNPWLPLAAPGFLYRKSLAPGSPKLPLKVIPGSWLPPWFL